MVFIYDEDAIVKIAMMEGERWRRQQLERKTSPYGFFYVKTAWDQSTLPEYAGTDLDWRELLEGAENVIYGEGGFHRYVAMENGELRFSRTHARSPNVQRAQELGFNLISNQPKGWFFLADQRCGQHSSFVCLSMLACHLQEGTRSLVLRVTPYPERLCVSRESCIEGIPR
jgi:hypothetical protein